MEENPSRNRKDSRMMSSLMDLKLHNNQKLEEVNEEEVLVPSFREEENNTETGPSKAAMIIKSIKISPSLKRRKASSIRPWS